MADLESPIAEEGESRHSGRSPESPYLPASPNTPHSAEFLHAIQSVLYVLVIALFAMAFTVQPIRIPSASMEPTLLVGDFLLLDKQAATPADSPLLPPSGIARGDVVVFHDPAGDPAVHLVKRVIALPGDHLHLHNGVVFLNGQPLQEDYAIHRPGPADLYRDDFPDLHTLDPAVTPAWWLSLRQLVQHGELTVPPGLYFVLGDNRNDSEDSRYWGFVPRAAIIGKPRLIYFSLRTPGENDPRDSQSLRTALETHSSPPRPSFARWDRLLRVIH